VRQYAQGEDLGLDMHTDDSDITFNICLGKDFLGAGLSFCGVLGGPAHRKLSTVYKHVKAGRCRLKPVCVQACNEMSLACMTCFPCVMLCDLTTCLPLCGKNLISAVEIHIREAALEIELRDRFQTLLSIPTCATT